MVFFGTLHSDGYIFLFLLCFLFLFFSQLFVRLPQTSHLILNFCLLEDFKNNFIGLFLFVLGVRCWMGFSLLVVGEGCSLVVWCELFIAEASPVAEHGL